MPSPTGPAGTMILKGLKSTSNVGIDGELAYDLAIEALGAGRETSARNLPTTTKHVSKRCLSLSAGR